MLDFISIIKKEHAALEPAKSIFKNYHVMVMMIPLVLFAIGYIVLCRYLTMPQELWATVGFLASSVVFSFGYFYLVLNKYAKNKLKKMDISYNPSFFAHWGGEAFTAWRFKNFYKALVDKRILCEDQETDLSLLSQLALYFGDKGKEPSSYTFLKEFGRLVLIFLVPIWIQLLVFLFSKSKPEELNDVIQITVLLFMLIAMILYTSVMVWHGIESGFNTEAQRSNQIKNDLLNIKWNLERGKTSE